MSAKPPANIFPKPIDKGVDPEDIAGWSITEIIGQGGMGKVYKGNKGLDVAAIKIISPDKLHGEYLTRFRREIKAMKMINNLYVAEFKDADINFKIPYIAMEYIYGNPLNQLIHYKENFTEREWASIAIKLFMGLTDIHMRGELIHRDIKPHNIMKFKNTTGIKIIDFGVVKGANFNTLTHTDSNPGTKIYMSPEQLEEAKVITNKTDIFSMGMTLVELATHKHPFTLDKSIHYVPAHILSKSPDLVGLTENQKIICEMALEKDPDIRSSAQEIVSTIRKLYKLPLFPIRPPSSSALIRVPSITRNNKNADTNLEGVLQEFDQIKKVAKRIEVAQKISKKTLPSQGSLDNFSDFLAYFLMGVRDTFILNIASAKFSSSAYIQGITEAEKMITLEAISNNFLEPKLNQTELTKMNGLGWEDPEEKLPNYTIFCKQDQVTLNKMSKVIVKTIFEVYGAEINTTFFLRPITESQAKEIHKKFNIKLEDDGSFKLPAENEVKKVTKNNSYVDWRLIGIFDSNTPNLLKEFLAVNRKTHRVYRRSAKKWIFERIDSDVLSEFPLALPLSTKSIALFDKAQELRKSLEYNNFTFEYVNFAPTPSDEFLEKHKLNRLLSKRIPKELMVIYYNTKVRVNKQIAGLVMWDQDGWLWLRKEGKWQIIQDDIWEFSLSIDDVRPEFIDFYDNFNRNGQKLLTEEIIKEFIHDSDEQEVRVAKQDRVAKGDRVAKEITESKDNKKLIYSELPSALQNLIRDLVKRVEEKIGEDSSVFVFYLQEFMSGKNSYTQSELTSYMAKLLRILA